MSISVCTDFRYGYVSDLYGFPAIFSFGILRSEVGDWTAMEHLQTANRYDVYFMIVRTSISTLSLLPV